jgi:hypothetical protein
MGGKCEMNVNEIWWEGAGCIHHRTQDGEQRQYVVKKVMNFQVVLKVRNFLTR